MPILKMPMKIKLNYLSHTFELGLADKIPKVSPIPLPDIIIPLFYAIFYENLTNQILPFPLQYKYDHE